MNQNALLDRLRAFGKTLPVLVADISDDDATWKPNDGAWSVLEIVRHLGDEEVEDFRMRVRMTLEDPNAAWPPIDPEQAAIDRAYNDGKLKDAVACFVTERSKSIGWLESLFPVSDEKWNHAYVHPKFGATPAGEIMSSWVAHDLLHLRQIVKRMYQLTQRDAGRFDVGYAGNW